MRNDTLPRLQNVGQGPALLETTPAMTQIKHDGSEWRIGDEEWPRWVRMGWIPPDALVNSPRWTRGLWRQADSLEVYHLFRPSPQAAPTRKVEPEPDKVPRHGPFGMFRGPGLSVTEWLIIVNLVIGIALYAWWGESYSTNLWAFSADLKQHLGQGWIPVLMIPVFLHANPSHLLGNMLTFFAAGAVVEEFYGRKRMLLLYLFSGLTSSLLSLARVKDVLSVGASGAIMGMYGVGLVFLLRERRHFTDSQRYRLRRVQLPFFALLVLPAILHADFYAHLGGFLGGALLALFIAPLAERVPRPGHLPEEPADSPNVVTTPKFEGPVLVKPTVTQSAPTSEGGSSRPSAPQSPTASQRSASPPRPAAPKRPTGPIRPSPLRRPSGPRPPHSPREGERPT